MSNLTTKIWTSEDTYNVSTEFTRIEEILAYLSKETKNTFITTTNFQQTINDMKGYWGTTTIFVGLNKTIIDVSVQSAIAFTYSYDTQTGKITIDAIGILSKFKLECSIKTQDIPKKWEYTDIPYQTDILRYIDAINLILKKYNEKEQEFTQVDYFNLTLANELEQGLAKCLNLLNNE